ncbi:MAG: hypothetical protein WCT04_04265 [Planctomycetota bacterium]
METATAAPLNAQAYPINPKPILAQNILAEVALVGVTYFFTAFVASMFISMCGPGCCFVFYTILAGVSGLLMLRELFFTRLLCFAFLLLFMFGMWHEKEVRDTHRERALKRAIQMQYNDMQKQE